MTTRKKRRGYKAPKKRKPAKKCKPSKNDIAINGAAIALLSIW